jgi:hypothetical protein
MNDKFEDLLYNSGLTSQGCWDKLDEWDREAVLKFGELIVLECAGIFEGLYTDQRRPERIDTRIKQHFGVK